jgi:hypothetical protein
MGALLDGNPGHNRPPNCRNISGLPISQSCLGFHPPVTSLLGWAPLAVGSTVQSPRARLAPLKTNTYVKCNTCRVQCSAVQGCNSNHTLTTGLPMSRPKRAGSRSGTSPGLLAALSPAFIHSCYTCSRSSFEQRQPIPNATEHTKQQTDQTNKQRQLPSRASRVMSNNLLCSTP